MRNNLRDRRESKGLLPEQVATFVGIKKRMYYAIESGRANPSWPVAKKLGDLFDEDPRILLAEKAETTC